LRENNELSNDEVEYLKALTKNTNEKIFEITGALNITEKNQNYFSKIVEHAIEFDEVHVLKLDHERRLKNLQNLTGERHVIEVKFSKWLKKSIEHKSDKCIEYCYSMMKSFDIQTYFTDLTSTRDKKFIQDFVSKYKNKSVNHYNLNNSEGGKFNNIDSLKQLIETNNLEILEYSVEFSTQQALDKALFITKGDQLEIIKLLVSKGARFMVQDTYSSSNRIVLEQLTAMVKFLFDEVSKKSK